MSRFDRLEREILRADGNPSGIFLPFGMEPIAHQAAEMWSAEWRGVGFRLVTRREGETVTAWLQFASEDDEARLVDSV
jgi:hypothetical protein